MQKFQNILSLSPNHCGPLRDTKTSKFFSHSFSRCNSEKLIRALRCFKNKNKYHNTISKILFPIKMIGSPDFHLLGWCPAGPVLPDMEKVPL